jgi:hypothetical protein
VGGFDVSSDSAWIVYRADQETNDVDELFRVRPDGTQLAKLNPPPVVGGSVAFDAWAINSGGDYVVYMTNQDVYSASEVYSVNISTLDATPLNQSLLSYEDVSYWVISPYGQRIAYVADIGGYNYNELWAVNVDGTDRTRLGTVDAAEGWTILDAAFTPDASKVVYREDHYVYDPALLRIAAADGSGAARLVGPPQSNRGVTNFELTPDNRYAVYRSNSDDATTFELFAAAIGPDADVDYVIDDCDCAAADPGVFAAAMGEVAIVAFHADGTLVWSGTGAEFGSGSGYDVLSGQVAELPAPGASDVCLEDAITETQTVVTSDPLPGSAVYFLVRPANQCGAGSYGVASNGLERLGTACP